MMSTEKSQNQFKFNLWLGLLIFLILLGLGIVPRLLRQREISAQAQLIKGPLPVNITKPSYKKPNELTLPGNIEAIREVPIYARTSGYLKNRLVDIGDRVQAGQLLATIESPEVDQELSQAKADLAQAQAAAKQAKANRDLAQTTLARSKALKEEQLISQQNLDEKQANLNARVADYEAALASVGAQAANVRRLTALQAFQRVKAPFSGIISKRNLSIEVGALISAGSGSDSQELFRMAQTDRLRIQISIPQSEAAAIKEGQSVEVTVPELPQKPFRGVLSRSSGALDATSRTLLAEVILENPGNQLLPGMYAQVKLKPADENQVLVIPANALVIRSQGPQVALVTEEETVHYQNIQLGRDFGTEVEILAGLESDSRLVINPSDDITEGRHVRTVEVRQKPAVK